MNRNFVFLLCVTTVLAASPPRKPARRNLPAKVDASRATVVHDVSVVDVVNGVAEPHRNVYIRDGKILSIGPAVKPAVSAHVIAGENKFLIPGLWDMHVHLWQKDPQFSLFLANGVTGVRDMGSDFSQIQAWRSKIQAGKLLGPRIMASGPPLEGPDEIPNPRMSPQMIRTPEEARRAFDQLDDMHVDFIEVLPGLRWDAYFALTEYTRHWGHRVAGNLPESVTAQQAVDARQGTIEDLDGVLLSCSSDEKELRRQRRDALEKQDQVALDRITAAVLDTYSKRKAGRLFADFRIFDVMETPLLSAHKRQSVPGTQQDQHFQYVSAATRKQWPEAAQPQTLNSLTYERYFSVVAEMNGAGVQFLAGTDTGFPFSVPGFELHEELELLVRAGLSPAQALRAATIFPARNLRQEAILGTVQPQKIADLVLLEGNPLADIANIRKISAVFVNGKYFGKSDLAAMLVHGATKAE